MPIVNASSALQRFTVLDLTRVRAGPTAVRQLADWGADVIKVELPEHLEAGKVWAAPATVRISKICIATNAALRSTSNRLRELQPFVASLPRPTWWSRTSAPM